MRLTPVATYERTVRASLDHVRENVLDWEHLPWLHPETFSHVRLLERLRRSVPLASAHSTSSSTRCCGSRTRR
jgi:hypothetical protein